MFEAIEENGHWGKEKKNQRVYIPVQLLESIGKHKQVVHVTKTEEWKIDVCNVEMSVCISC